MSKFAKLFEFGDKQVLMEKVDEDADGKECWGLRAVTHDRFIFTITYKYETEKDRDDDFEKLATSHAEAFLLQASKFVTLGGG